MLPIAATVLFRFEDLPVAQMRTSHKDPEVAAGLAAIAKLDEQLREVSLKVCLHLLWQPLLKPLGLCPLEAVL